jgi:hypothetical protein
LYKHFSGKGSSLVNEPLSIKGLIEAMAEEKTYKEAGEQPPSTVEQQAPAVAEDNAPASSEPKATSIPSANQPDPEVLTEGANPEAVQEKKPKKAIAENTAKERAAGEAVDAETTAKAKPAKAAKKEKAPALEDKPFADFIQQDYMPAIQKALAAQGVKNLDLAFEKQKILVTGYSQAPECWQIIGRWSAGQNQPRQFNIYFFGEDIQGQRAFSYTESGGKPSTLEPFLIDERKVNLDLLIYGIMQRLNGQKWLVRN